VKTKLLFWFIPMVFFSSRLCAQDISLYQQFNGRYDFVFVGNTLNPGENSFIPCMINTTSTANLALASDDVIESAYLYWAGSGTGDFNVKINGQEIVAARNFSLTQISSGLPFFSAFADITPLVQATGNGDYTMTDLDLTSIITPETYCENQTNFAGWAIVVVYKNDSLPLNQLQIYDGLDYVAESHSEVNITLDQLNVIDDIGAKIGFVAWEGDAAIANGENLRLNGEDLSNALNPVGNAFNSTNTITDSSDLYNMDLDIYDIQDNIAIGDTTAAIQLTSLQDFVMINVIVTKLNNQLPDATIAVNNMALQCNSRTITVDYTVSNLNSTDILPAGTQISIYADGIYIGNAMTATTLPIGASENLQVTLLIPDSIPDTFNLVFAADDKLGTGIGSVTELIETNNTFTTSVSFLLPPEFNQPQDVISCNQHLGSGTFDFSNYPDTIKINPDDVVTFYESENDAANESNAIGNTSNYFTQTTPKPIFVRIENPQSCYSIGAFNLRVRNCPPTVYNYISANNDGLNDFFFIDGLRDIFLNFEVAIYNRWGVLIWKGNNNSENWNGTATKGLRIGGNEVPDGTYFYVLDLHDPDYTSPMTGFLYLNR
jgi:gliding motility-associated-like protein